MYPEAQDVRAGRLYLRRHPSEISSPAHPDHKVHTGHHREGPRRWLLLRPQLVAGRVWDPAPSRWSEVYRSSPTTQPSWPGGTANRVAGFDHLLGSVGHEHGR